MVARKGNTGDLRKRGDLTGSIFNRKFFHKKPAAAGQII
jgi:hypothetical protein